MMSYTCVKLHMPVLFQCHTCVALHMTTHVMCYTCVKLLKMKHMCSVAYIHCFILRLYNYTQWASDVISLLKKIHRGDTYKDASIMCVSELGQTQAGVILNKVVTIEMFILYQIKHEKSQKKKKQIIHNKI